jgi:hypothetical protein
MAAKLVLKNMRTKFFTILKQTLFSKAINFITLNLKTPNEKNIQTPSGCIAMPTRNVHVWSAHRKLFRQ